MSKFKTSWLAILGLILCFAPIGGAVIINTEALPSEQTNIATVLITLVGIVVCFISLNRPHSSDIGKKGTQVATLGFVIGVILFMAYAICIPGGIAMRYRARESDVKSAAHCLQTAVEDYKKNPGKNGLKPGSPVELSDAVAGFLPEYVREKENPFDKRQRYGAGGIVFGSPGGKGQIGYIFTDPEKPYQIVALGRYGTPILTLQEEP